MIPAAGARPHAVAGSALAVTGYALAGLLVLAGIVLMAVLVVRGRRPAAGVGAADGEPLDALTDDVAHRREPVPAIRAAEPADEPRLAEIEAHGVEGLEGSGLGALPSASLRDSIESASILLVAGRPPVAYIRVDDVDGNAHVDQLAVLPSMARQGIGKALLDAAVDWAERRGYRAMTLSTFADSEWNARVYDATGFTPTEQLTPGLRELRDWERAIGLDAIGARVVMRRDLSA